MGAGFGRLAEGTQRSSRDSHKLEGGVKIKSVEHGKLEGKGGYEQGTLNVSELAPSVGKYTSKLYGEGLYGVNWKLHVPCPDDGRSKVDISFGRLGPSMRTDRGQSPEVTLVALRTDEHCHRIVGSPIRQPCYLQKSQRRLLIYAADMYTTSWTTEVSDNTLLSPLGYTFKGSRGTLEALLYRYDRRRYTRGRGTGKTGLRDECTDTGHTGRPWGHWCGSAKIQSRPKALYINDHNSVLSSSLVFARFSEALGGPVIPLSRQPDWGAVPECKYRREPCAMRSVALSGTSRNYCRLEVLLGLANLDSLQLAPHPRLLGSLAAYT